jgi:lysine 6-dehydrogenase
MNILLLGGVGGVSLEASRDLFDRGGFDRITLADADLEKAMTFAREIGLDSSCVTRVDATDLAAVTALMRGHDVALNGLPKAFALSVLRAAIEAKTNVVDLGSPTEDLESLDSEARRAGITYVAGCGATPGITNMMAARAAEHLDSVEEISVNFAAFRAFALSPALIHTTLWEFDPAIKERVYFENDVFRSVPPFSGEKVIDFPEPIGSQSVFFVPHGETRTLPRNLKAKRVYTRGCFSPRVMRFLRVILEYGFYSTEPIQIDGAKIGPRQLLTEYLLRVPEGREEKIWGYGLHVEVTGRRSGQSVKHTLWTTHPSIDEWGIPGAYSKNVAMPLAVGVRLLMEGRQRGSGVGAPEIMFPVEVFFSQLEARGMKLHEKRSVS